MAHNLATINGRVAMAYQGDTPWHQLGTRLDGDVVHSIRASLEAASLNWTVSKQPAYAKIDDAFYPIPDREAVIRDSDRTVLGVVSKWYSVIQNDAIEAVFQTALEEFGLTVEAAGALGRGERVWMLFKLPASREIVPGDYITGYGLVVLGHDGTHCFEFRPTPIRVVCQNTLNMAVGAGGHKGRIFGIPHYGNIDQQIAAARTLVTDVLAAMQATSDTFTTLAQRRMTPAEVIAYIEGVFPAPTPKPGQEEKAVSKFLAEKRAKVAELVFRGAGAELALQTTDGEPNAWACYNAVTEYFDHVATAEASEKRRVQVAQSAVFGTFYDVKLAALERAQALVAA